MEGMKRIALWLARLYLWATHRLYNEFAWSYDVVSWLVSFGQWDRWRKSALDHAVGQRILEVGFGTGELLIEMARRGMHVCGIDLSPAMHRITARKMAQRGIQAPRVQALAQRAPFADESFDTIVATFPAEYIASPATLREVVRLLRSPDPDTGVEGERFVVVGMVANLNSRLLNRATDLFFGVPAKRILTEYVRHATAAGLDVTVTAPRGRGPKMPVLIAEKRAQRDVSR
jgi:ubiquinone/menaquinone biosynthesis C-methylase UbiE